MEQAGTIVRVLVLHKVVDTVNVTVVTPPNCLAYCKARGLESGPCSRSEEASWYDSYVPYTKPYCSFEGPTSGTLVASALK